MKDLGLGGHFKAELYSGLIFDERNVHKQCRKCNRFKNGNELQYRKGLIESYGVEFVDKLETDSITKKEFTSSQNRTEQKIKYNDILNKKIK
jgi:hypothetical protein